MKFLFMLLFLSSCGLTKQSLTKQSLVKQKVSKNKSIQNIFGPVVLTKNKRAPSSVKNLIVGKVYKIAVPDKLYRKTKNQEISTCKPVFGARVEFLGWDEGQALLDYTSFMDAPSKEFCKDGFVFAPEAVFKKSTQSFIFIQKQLLILEANMLTILNKNISSNEITAKTFLDAKKIIKIGEIFTTDREKVRPLGIKGWNSLKVKESNFMKGYLKPRTHLLMGKFCSPKSAKLKVIGFDPQEKGDVKNIFVQVFQENNSNVFGLFVRAFSQYFGACPVDTYFFINSKELTSI